MNPDQPSREQIEARITALLLGELPAAEADLLRWTISRDPELQKLHDELKVTIGFVREAMKNPTGAPMDPKTPLKLPQERKETLLAHFKTVRPQSADLPWLKRIEIPTKFSPLIPALAVIAIIAVLAAMLLPVLNRAQTKSFTAAMTQSTLGIHENDIRQISPVMKPWNSDSYQASRSPKSTGEGKSSVAPTPAPIALPNTESSQTASEEATNGVYSQNVVGYVNISQPQDKTFVQIHDEFASGRNDALTTRESQNAETVFMTPGASAPPPNSALPSTPASSQAEVPTIAMAIPPPMAGQEIPPVPAGGNYTFAEPSPLPKVEPGLGRNRVDGNNIYVTGSNFASWSGLAYSADRQLQDHGGGGGAGGIAGGPTEKSPFISTYGFVISTNYIAEDQSLAFNGVPAGTTLDGNRNFGRSQISGTTGLADGASQGSLQDALKNYQDQDVKIQAMQSAVEQFRKRYNVHDSDVQSTAPMPALSSEQIQALNEKLVEQKAVSLELEEKVAELQAIQAKNPGELPDALLAISPDPTLSGLVGQQHENKQMHAGESDSNLQQQINNRVNGIMYGLESQAVASEAEVAGFTNQLADIESQGQGKFESGQSYWIARAKLQDLRDLHKSLGEKIESDEADASMPKSALVTIVNPAQPGQSQSLWQRLTGQVESQARIQINPDITSAAPTAYAPYDPYFLETELNTIKSDVVLGRVVDALKLDQAWSKGEGAQLSRNDAITRLRSHLDVQSDENTRDVEIGAKSDKPDEAAKIANAVVEAYRQYRLEMHSNEMDSGVEHLQREYAKEDGEIRQLRAQLQQTEVPGAAGAERATQTPMSVKQAYIRPTPPQPNAPIPQPEIQTSDNAFSTFSLNVSDVSFKLAMASLEKGQMPAPASIRSEEFINAFDYHDPEPLQGEPLAFASERANDPFAHERDFLRFSIKAAAAGRQQGRALNLVLLLDTSGSMERADRVAIIREALRVLSSQLQPQDTVSVVTFARTARLWADGIPGDRAGATLDKVGSITPDGGTNLEEAMRLAYETALRHFIAGGMNRVVLLTDGAANLGDVDPQALTHKVDAERRQGIALDCFGIGWDDYNDDLLEQLSSNGDGRYAFINSPDEAATEFAAKLAGALQVAAEDVKVQVEFNPNRVSAWRQIGYAKHQLAKQQFRDNTVAAGAIASREAGNALYVIETRPDGEGPIATVRVRYRVPGTQDVRERSWLVEYTGAAPELAQSGRAMRLAVTAAEISEWMADSPFAQEVTPDELLNYLSGVPQYYGTDKRPEQLEWMIREAKSVAGK